MKTIELRLADYLIPNGKYPYEKLFEDMENGIAQGATVHVISVPGFMMAIGHPTPDDSFFIRDGIKYPWSDCTTAHCYYSTAKDCIRLENGIEFE